MLPHSYVAFFTDRTSLCPSKVEMKEVIHILRGHGEALENMAVISMAHLVQQPNSLLTSSVG